MVSLDPPSPIAYHDSGLLAHVSRNGGEVLSVPPQAIFEFLLLDHRPVTGRALSLRLALASRSRFRSGRHIWLGHERLLGLRTLRRTVLQDLRRLLRRVLREILR